MSKTDQHLAQAFAQLSKAAARRKIYSRKATREGRPDVARLLRAMSASEAVQARRLFNSLIGKYWKTTQSSLTIALMKDQPCFMHSLNCGQRKPGCGPFILLIAGM
jgi:rubrerythrin